jgi:hypothetical protein
MAGAASPLRYRANKAELGQEVTCICKCTDDYINIEASEAKVAHTWRQQLSHGCCLDDSFSSEDVYTAYWLKHVELHELIR